MTVRRRRPGPPPLLVAVPAAAVLLAGLGVAGLHLADRATVLDEGDAVAAFRAGPTPSPTPPGAELPSSGPAAAAGAGPRGPLASSSATAGPPAPGTAPAGPAPAAAVGGGSIRPAPSASPVPAAPRDVPPGVYSYATSGSEQVDVLGGARHDYPDSTTITYRRSGCGTLERWQPLQERVGESLTCAGAAGSELRASFQQRSFFGRSQSVSFTCSPGAPLLPREPRPGGTTRGSCRSDDSTLALTTKVVGVESLDVGGTAVPVVHLSVTGTLTGATRGRSDREVWLARDGLLVRIEAHTDTDADTDGGTVRYQEDYRLRLSSLTPRT